MTAFESGAATDVGQVRAHNEDTFVVAGSVFVVADGMGGHNGGEIASRIAVDRLAAIGPSSSPSMTTENVLASTSNTLPRSGMVRTMPSLETTVRLPLDASSTTPQTPS